MVSYLPLQAAGVPHIKNLVSIVLNSTSISYARRWDQDLRLDDNVLFDTPIEARDLALL
jgi:pSer/pThr/pTyr-binding forkhead associated (FHA) protein